MTSLKSVERSRERTSFSQERRDGLEILFSPLLRKYCGESLVHAFSTRQVADSERRYPEPSMELSEKHAVEDDSPGKNSMEPYDWFNLGGAVGDDAVKAQAMRNRLRFARALGLEDEKLFVAGQVHSNEVRILSKSKEVADLRSCDGLISKERRIPMLLHFADCVPVIVVDWKESIAGIFHAGWRGTAANIVSRGVELMVKELGASADNLIASVGPAIGPCCYPTSREVAHKLAATTEGAGQLIEDSYDYDSDADKNSLQPRPDLKGINALQLLNAGVAVVEVSDCCTACRFDLFYSHRQSGGITGRQGAIVAFN